MVILSPNELKKIAKSKGIKGHKNMSKDKLLNILDEQKQARRYKIKGVFYAP